MRRWIAPASAGYLMFLGSALAQPQQDNAELVEMVRALQARVTQLEAQLSKAKPKLEDRNKAAPAPIAQPVREGRVEFTKARAEAHFAPPPRPSPTWSGVYWGASFGGAITEGRVSSNERYTAAVPSNSAPFNLTGQSILSVSGPDGGFGGVLDTFVGANVAFGAFLAGLQFEGSIAELSFNSEGQRDYTYFNANGLTGQTAIGDFRPHVHSRWMVSVLARAGVLIDPSTLAYAIGGWTGAMFEYENVTDNLFFQPGDQFWANGITVGGGIEKRLSGPWSIKGEYRYTHFPEVTVSNNFAWSSSGAPFTGTQTNTIQTRFENDMHVLRVGISYLFGVHRD